MYKYCKKKKEKDDRQFMKICTYEVPEDKKFSKNFLEYLNLDDFHV